MSPTNIRSDCLSCLSGLFGLSGLSDVTGSKLPVEDNLQPSSRSTLTSTSAFSDAGLATRIMQIDSEPLQAPSEILYRFPDAK
jgi:hypothetical protein